MSVQAGQLVVAEFTTRNFSSGIKTNADTLPTAVLVDQGADTAATVTIANTGTGIYTASVTLPAGLGAGDIVGIRVAATVGGISDNSVVWEDTIDGSLTNIPAAVWAYVSRTLTSFGPIQPGDFDPSQPFADPHVGDVGTQLVVVIVDQDLTVVDVSAGTSLTILLKKPGSRGTVLTKTAVLDTTGVDGKIRYNTIAGDFDQSGLYKIQGIVTLGGATFHSVDSEFMVKGNLV